MNVWGLLVCVAMCLTVSVSAQQTPCSSKDPGPFLATPPTLTMDVYEATAQVPDLSSNPDKYRAELRLYGQVGGPGSDGIMVEVMPDYQFMNPEDSFRFISDGGVNYVQMYKPLDRDGPTAALDDDTNVFSFTLKCTQKSNMSNSVYYDTKITVLDVNDNDPQFVNLTSKLTLNELTPPGLPVLTMKAEDLDFNSNLSYSLLPRNDLADDMSSYFQVNSLTGELSVSGHLDYETMAQGSLVLTVEDRGTPARTATATVAVVVEDGDDHGPVFVYPGCWTHRARCAWPKYTTSTLLTQNQPIEVLPVPNKVKTSVLIKAKDLDLAANPVSFSIASTIPPGQEGMFSVTTSLTGKGEYAATITPTTTTTVPHGFEIFLQAEEQSAHKRFEVAMIFFEDPNNVCSSGTSSAQKQPDQSQNTSTEEEEDDYTKPVIALIVVVAILATFLLCLAIAFFCVIRSVSTSRSSDVTLTPM